MERFFSQVPASFQCEDNKVDLLKSALLGKPCASAAVSDLHKKGASFVPFSANIANGLQNWLDEQQVLAKATIKAK